VVKIIMSRRVATLFSGGKDSTYSLHWAILQGMEVSCLITINPRARDSWMFHRPGLGISRLQAQALGIPQIFMESSGIKEEELKDLKKALEKAINDYGIEAIVVGALLSDYQRMRVVLVAEELGLKVFTPLWRINQEKYMRDLVRSGFKILVVSISTYGVPKSIVGKVLDEKLVEFIINRAKSYKFNPAFEGGEAETLVLDAPLFKERLVVEGKVVELSEFEAEFIIERAWLEPKFKH